MRSETASIRALTFTSDHLTLELEVTGNSLLGQIFPAAGRDARDPHPGGRDQHDRGGRDRLLLGRPDPRTVPFRLRSRASDGTHVLTGWITI